MKRRDLLKSFLTIPIIALPSAIQAKSETKNEKSEFLKVPEGWEDLGTISFRRKGDKLEAVMYGDFAGYKRDIGGHWQGGYNSSMSYDRDKIPKNYKEFWEEMTLQRELKSLAEKLLQASTKWYR